MSATRYESPPLLVVGPRRFVPLNADTMLRWLSTSSSSYASYESPPLLILCRTAQLRRSVDEVRRPLPSRASAPPRNPGRADALRTPGGWPGPSRHAASRLSTSPRRLSTSSSAAVAALATAGPARGLATAGWAWSAAVMVPRSSAALGAGVVARVGEGMESACASSRCCRCCRRRFLRPLGSA